MIELTRASFQYENSDRGVQDISLSVKSGECVVLTGFSGCGKTTVTRLANGLAPSYYPGVFSGSVRIDGKDISGLSTWEIGRLVGSVFQDPKSQFFSSELAGEVAFPSENYGLPAREIRERTDAAIGRRTAIRTELASAVLRIAVLAPRTSRKVVSVILRCRIAAIPTRCRSAVLCI